MKRLIYTTAARESLATIYDFVFDLADSDVAFSTIDRLRAKLRQLAELSGVLGRPREELGADIRSFPFRGYVIFFRYEGEDLVVLKVLSARRDIDAHFSEAD